MAIATRGTSCPSFLFALLLPVIFAGYGNPPRWYRLPFFPICAFLPVIFWGRAQRFMQRRLFSPAATALIIIFASLLYPALKLFYREAASDLRDLGLELKGTTPPG